MNFDHKLKQYKTILAARTAAASNENMLFLKQLIKQDMNNDAHLQTQ